MNIQTALRSAAAAAFGMALIGSAAPAGAQTIGFKLGASLSNLSFDSSGNAEVETDRRTGFAGGGSIGFGLGRFGVALEILSVSKGADNIGGPGDPLNIHLEYVEIPLLLQVPLMVGSSFSPYVFGGPAVAFEVRCESAGDSDEGTCNSNNSFDRKKTDIGLAGGAGLAFAMGPGSILVEARHTWGMSNIASDAPTGTTVKNRATYIMAGYSIPLSRR